MKLAIIGYGKMGKTIEPIALQRGHTTVQIQNATDRQSLLAEKPDCAIEFTRPESAIDNIRFCLAHQIPVVVGTTGWYQHYETLKQETIECGGALLAATNFSVGVHLFFHLNHLLAKLMNQYSDYDVAIREIHHTEKRDAPSGTAITTADKILTNLDRKSRWQLNGADNPNTLRIDAIREPHVPGTHEVHWNSETDEILIRHTAHNRRGFALGAILSAEFLHDKKGVFTMNDLLQIKL